ncbi:MAG TPA: hypothetical protein PKH79_00340 [Prolixibacteraceae bacterium]|nr:hypothetical protein [Prolixibacteraceae bacterium]HPS11649.1 hypothetical protein [Prolixibacteraceae bacterium]
MKDTALTYSARIVPKIFNPYLIPTLGLLAIMNYIPGVEFFSAKLKFLLLGVVFVSTCFIPFVFIALGHLNKIWDKESARVFDRVMPNFFAALSCFLGSQFLGKLPVPGIFRIYLLGFCFLMIISTLVTIKWKLSDFTLSLGGLWGALLALNFKYGMDILWLIIIVVLVTGLVASSSLYTGKESPRQVYGGFLTGTIGIFLLIFLL